MQPKLKILHVISGLQMGGAEMTLYKLLSRIDRNQYDNCIVSLSGGGVIADQISSLGYRVECCDLKQVFSAPATLMRLRKIVHSYKPDVIQCWMYHGNLVGTLLQSLVSRQSLLVWNIRHSLISLQSNRFMTRQVIKLNKWLSSRPQAIIYNSSRVAEEHEAYGYEASRARVISNGFDTKLYKPNEKYRTAMRASLGIKPEQIVIGYVARYHPVKDHRNFCEAAALILDANRNSRFVMVGRGVTKDNEELRALLKRYRLEENAILMGERDSLEQVIPGFDIACSASMGESFPNTIGEAMACGVPCVATDAGRSADIIGDTGRLVPISDPDALAREVAALSTIEASERLQLGTNARKRIESLFSIEVMEQHYQDLYSQLALRESLPNTNQLRSDLRI